MSTDVTAKAADPSTPDTGATQVTERQAREVAEAARETEWTRPSFAKELYLGRFDLSPDPPAPARRRRGRRERGEAFLGRAARVLRDARRRADRARGADPRRVHQGARRARRLRHEDPAGVRRPRPVDGLLRPGADAGRLGAPEPRRAAVGAPVDRRARAGEDVRHRGAEAASSCPRCAGGAISAFLLTEPDVGSDPARLGTTATPTEDGEAYLLDGVKLWTTNGVIAELLVVMAAVPEARRAAAAASRAFVVEADAAGITVENRNAFMGLRGIENGVTRFHQVRVPGREPARQGGRGPQDRPDHPQHRPALDPRDVRRRRQVVPQDRPRVVERRGSSGASRSASTRRSPPRSPFIAATTFALEAVLDLSAQLADAGTKDIRIEAALAKLWASEMACQIADELVQIRGGRGFETADSLAARGERAVPAEQVAARPADQPDLRGLVGDHAAADRPRGGRRPPQGGRRPGHRRRRPRRPRRRRRSRPAASTPSGCRSWWSARARSRRRTTSSGALAKHLRYVERSSRKLARQTFYGMAAGRRSWSTGRPSSAASSTSAPSCSRWRRPARGPRCSRDAGPDAGRGGVRAGRRLLPAGPAAGRDAVRRAVEQHRRRPTGVVARKLLDGDYTWLEAGVLDQSEGTGPWIASGRRAPATSPTSTAPTASPSPARRELREGCGFWAR